MIEHACDMEEREKKLLLTEFCEYDIDDVDEMDAEDLDAAVDEAINHFHEYIEDEIHQYYDGMIDIDDEQVSLYEILSLKADIDDDSDMFPNGRDYDAEDYDD